MIQTHIRPQNESEHILTNIVDFSPRGVGQKVAGYAGVQESDEYSRIFYNRPQNEDEQHSTNIGPRGLGHKVAGYLKYP